MGDYPSNDIQHAVALFGQLNHAGPATRNILPYDADRFRHRGVGLSGMHLQRARSRSEQLPELPRSSSSYPISLLKFIGSADPSSQCKQLDYAILIIDLPAV